MYIHVQQHRRPRHPLFWRRRGVLSIRGKGAPYRETVTPAVADEARGMVTVRKKKPNSFFFKFHAVSHIRQKEEPGNLDDTSFP